MRAFLTRGFSQLFIAPALIIILFLLLVTPLKRHIHLVLNHLTYQIGVNLNNIASEKYVGWIKSQPDELVDAKSSIFLNKPVRFRDIAINPQNSVLGASATARGKKRIEVDLSEQRLYMKEGEATVGSFLVSTGKWYPTPTGEWPIWIKLRYTRMQGGSKALGTYYDLKNVPYTMYYYRGYGIHGAYWHSNFGQPMSHGCVNMKPEEAGIVFNWADVGTRVVVHD